MENLFKEEEEILSWRRSVGGSQIWEDGSS